VSVHGAATGCRVAGSPDQASRLARQVCFLVVVHNTIWYSQMTVDRPFYIDMGSYNELLPLMK
jgi:hypothetical protein